MIANGGASARCRAPNRLAIITPGIASPREAVIKPFRVGIVQCRGTPSDVGRA